MAGQKKKQTGVEGLLAPLDKAEFISFFFFISKTNRVFFLKITNTFIYSSRVVLSLTFYFTVLRLAY